eukprot:scaffold780_cov99-Isochrysis_galbana.AAC.5
MTGATGSTGVSNQTKGLACAEHQSGRGCGASLRSEKRRASFSEDEHAPPRHFISLCRFEKPRSARRLIHHTPFFLTSS